MTDARTHDAPSLDPPDTHNCRTDGHEYRPSGKAMRIDGEECREFRCIHCGKEVFE